MNPFTESTVARPLAKSIFLRRRRNLPAQPAAGSPKPKPKPKPRLTVLAMLACTALVAFSTLLVSNVTYAADVNQATEEQLKGVRGIGPKTAQIIVEERTRGGSYESFSDLTDRVKGIGPKKAEALQHAGLTIGAQTASGRNPPASALKSPAK